MGSINNSFRFGTVDSADYNLLVAGDGTFNAPERDVDTIEIPGRNGDLLIDKGRFKNITVEYTVYCYADDLETFRTQLRNFRNALSSQKGYQRLTDTFHPDEYRLGTFISGFEAEPVMFNTVAEVVLKFNCKPQRFLFTGEEVFTLGQWGETETYSGSIVSFDGTETTAIKSLKVNITPKQSGSGDPSPSNVRPISGWDSVETNATGKNLIPRVQDSATLNGITPTLNADGSITLNGTATANANFYGERITLKAGSYIVSGGDSVVSGTCVVYLDGVSGSTDGGGGKAFTLTQDTRTRAVVRVYSGKTVSNVTIYPMVRISTESAEYGPYNGSTITTNLGQTVYGGVLDVVSGELVIDKGYTTLGAFNWDTLSSPDRSVFRANPINIIDIKYPATNNEVVNAISNTYKAVGYGPINPTTMDGVFAFSAKGGNATRIVVIDKRFTTINQFKAVINDIQVVFELATPITVTLTPTQVNTLLGSNNIWADAGTVEVEVGENPNILVNPTPFESCPVFEVEGSGTLTVNNSSMTIANNGTTIIDSEMMEAYEEENGAIISRNDSVSGEFPKLESGNNNIETVGLTSVKVTPRWWEV